VTGTVPQVDLVTLASLLTGSVSIADPVGRMIREDGGDWPAPGQGFTMIGDRRLAHLRELIERAVEDGIPGDFIECGVWRGGACIYARAVLKDLGSRRTVWVADSFQGCPEGDEHHGFRELAVPQSEVEENFRKFRLLDDKVKFISGFFADSLPGPVEQLAVLRVDCDMLTSTLTVMERMYPLLSPGGFVILDDYKALGTARDAVNHYRQVHAIRDCIVLDQATAFWQKGNN
jgi:O-methyltransferase